MTINYSQYLRESINDNMNMVILMSRKTGQWIKISQKINNIIKEIIEKQIDIDTLETLFTNTEDYIYIKTLIDKLLESSIINTSKISCSNKSYSVSWNITNKCNLFCKHCITDAGNKGINLSLDKLKSIYLNLKKLGISDLTITGGEPLYRNDFFELISFIRDLDKDLYIGLMTNGTLISDKNIQFIIDNFNHIDISLDGYDKKSCELIRGIGVFDKVINSISLLKQNRFSNISLSMVLTDENFKNKDIFLKLCNEYDINPVLRTFSEKGRGSNTNLLDEQKKISKKQDENIFIPKINDSLVRCSSCGAGVKEFVVEANGDIFPCNLFNEPEYKIENIFNLELLKNKLQSNEVSDYITPYDPDIYIKCKDCNIKFFCWSCLYKIKEMEYIPDEFNKRCDFQKKYLSQVWN